MKILKKTDATISKKGRRTPIQMQTAVVLEIKKNY